MKRYKKTRYPTPEELCQLAEYATEENEKSPNYMGLTVEEAYVAVVDNYLPCFPDTAHKIMLVLWDTGDDSYEAFTWSEAGKLERIPHWSAHGTVDARKGS